VAERLKGLQSYLAELMQLLATQPSLADHIDELEDFFALRDRISAIKKNSDMKMEQEAAAGDGEGGASKPMPLLEDELRRVELAVHQLWRLVTHGQTDPRDDHKVQNLLRICLNYLPRLLESACIGPFTEIDLIPDVQRALDELHEAIEKYNERALAFHIGQGHLFTGVQEGSDKDYGFYH
jgi:hypothetical protein